MGKFSKNRLTVTIGYVRHDYVFGIKKRSLAVGLQEIV